MSHEIPPKIKGYAFSPIEQRIIRLHSQGHTPRGIARALNVRRKPVENTLSMWELAHQGDVEHQMVGDELRVLKRDT